MAPTWPRAEHATSTLPAFIHFAGLINNARGELLDITAGVAALNSAVDGKSAPEFDLDIA